LEENECLPQIKIHSAKEEPAGDSYGWVFILWGLAYYTAIAWSARSHFHGAWSVCMASCMVLVSCIGRLKRHSAPATGIGRAIASLWTATSLAMLLLFPVLGAGGHLDGHSFIAIMAAMLGAANAASGLILRWKAQLACAAIWWAATAFSCVASETQLNAAFWIAIFLCQIAFGFYAMILDARRNNKNGSRV
jgi:hypothetical protein